MSGQVALDPLRRPMVTGQADGWGLGFQRLSQPVAQGRLHFGGRPERGASARAASPPVW